MKKLIVLLTALAMIGIANAELIVNGSFENPGVEGGIPDNWTEDFNCYGAHVGAAYLGSWGLHPGDGGPPGGAYQDITTVTGQYYDVSLWIQNFAFTPGTGNVKVLIGNPGTDTYTFENGTDTSVLYSLTGLVDQNLATNTDGTWSQASFQFQAIGTTTRFGVYNAPFSGSWSTNVDEVSVGGTLPTPTISLDKSSYYSGEDITITWSDGSADEGDEVALYLSCFAPIDICEPEAGPPLSWADVSSSTSGQITIDNVLVPGDYVAMYMQYGTCAVSNFVNFSVSAGPATGRDIEPKMLLSYCDGALADPQMYKEGSTYYITGTYSFYDEANPLATMYYTDDFDTVNSVQIKIETPAWGAGYQHMWAFEIYKHTDDTYHGYGYCYNQGAIYHFEPYPDPGTTTFPVLHWKANELLLSGDYDNRVIHDGSDLYMLSAKGESGHNKIFAQRMTNPGTMDSSYTPRRIMSENGDGLISELRNRPGAMKIHECPYIIEVNDGTTTKWVMSYTVGDYAIRRYKIGFGYSDVMIPSAGTEYTKVTKSDTLNVWGSGVGANEVLYVTQMEKPSWPNYHADIYGSPGSGEIFYYNDGYYLLLHATQPMMMDDMTGGSSYFGRSLWIVPLDFDFSGPMDTWAAVALPDGEVSPVITPTKADYAVNEDIVIDFQDAGQGAWSWVGLFNDGDPDTSTLAWIFCQGESATFLEPWGGDLWTWEATTYGFSGSATFTGLSQGDYDARLFFNNFAGYVPVANVDFTVGGGSCTPTDMHIEAVACSEIRCGGPNRYGSATVTIYDDCGNPVANALVDGTFDGDFSETIYDVATDANGQAVLTTSGCVKKPSFTFTVDDVTHGTLPHDSNDDLATGCSG